MYRSNSNHREGSFTSTSLSLFGFAGPIIYDVLYHATMEVGTFVRAKRISLQPVSGPVALPLPRPGALAAAESVWLRSYPKRPELGQEYQLYDDNASQQA